MRSITERLDSLLKSNRNVVASAICLVLVLDLMVAVREGVTRATPAAAAEDRGSASPAQMAAQQSAAAKAKASAAASAKKAAARNKLAAYKPGTYVKGLGTIPLGVDFKTKTIRLVYYWKGNRDTSGAAGSLGGSGQQGALDEADAFRRFIAYINKHANDPADRDCNTADNSCFMGYPFNLNGFHIDESCIQVHEDCIVEAGENQTGWNTAAQKIVGLKPLAAVASHGGLSDFACPIIAEAKIFNPVTYNLYPDLVSKTKGYCLPQGLSWEGQVALTIPWLQEQNKVQYCDEPTTRQGCRERKYGILFAEYDGEAAAVEGFRKQMLAAGINLAKSKSSRKFGGYSIYSVSTSLSTAGTQQGDVIDKFINDGVNTIIAPDSGAEITFTHVAPGKGYHPDYYVWPCSGEDAEGQVRLYDPQQWTRASGLSCYDQNWNLDLTLDDNARATQWFRQYREIACPGDPNCNTDPPSMGPLVYAGLLPVLVGITEAGPNMTMEKFFAGLHSFDHFRYHAITGPTADASHFLVTVGSKDGSQIGDVTRVVWNGSKRTAGNTTPGGYDYSNTRCRPGSGATCFQPSS